MRGCAVRAGAYRSAAFPSSATEAAGHEGSLQVAGAWGAEPPKRWSSPAGIRASTSRHLIRRHQLSGPRCRRSCRSSGPSPTIKRRAPALNSAKMKRSCTRSCSGPAVRGVRAKWVPLSVRTGSTSSGRTTPIGREEPSHRRSSSRWIDVNQGWKKRLGRRFGWERRFASLSCWRYRRPEKVISKVALASHGRRPREELWAPLAPRFLSAAPGRCLWPRPQRS